jgi:threonine synthase
MASRYHSTRGQSAAVEAKEAILEGMAPDGGLYIADTVLTPFTSLDAIEGADKYGEVAHVVLERLLPDFTSSELDDCIARAYGQQFDTPEIAPVVEVAGRGVLELWHGPTSAFKDLALQMLPQLVRVARGKDGRNIMVVCATSGDTGKAALAGFANVAGTGCCVYYPHNKVSDIQHLQMATQEGNNVAVVAIEGTFDDAQSAVKRIFANDELAARLATANTVLSSANSINVGRLVSQVVYYANSWRLLRKRGTLAGSEAFDVCVPTGNFGNVLAAYYAKCLGIPIRKLVVASNENNVLTDFLTTGTYDRRRPFHQTISPSMDILISSNLERLLYLASDGDSELVAHLMKSLATEGAYTVPPALFERITATFEAGYTTQEETRSQIATTWKRDGYLLDPHTAVAMHVVEARDAAAAGVAAGAVEKSGVYTLVASTASPYKFSRDVLASLGEDVSALDGFGCMDALHAKTGVAVPPALSALREKPVRFTQVVSVDGMEAALEEACARVF